MSDFSPSSLPWLALTAREDGLGPEAVRAFLAVQ